ncbi:hypothetical protein SK629_1300 [Streptococcus mitis]|uniref:Uncharacterized protein n=1 Tax=Streptococcus mitis TaxID=28037 RepID=A0A081PVE9_STRMT|nr:hypothetical protein SK629_1300 [Streptococcus mitis]
MIPSFLALVKIKSYFFEKFVFVFIFWLGFHIKRENHIDSLPMLVFP